MSLKDRIDADLREAMKAQDRTRLGVLRMLKARMIEAEVDQRAKRGADYRLGDAEALEAIATYAKQRRDSIDSFRQAGRTEMAAQEEAELAIVQTYLPRQLSAEEITALAKEVIAATGAKSAREMGAVMKALVPKVKGAADGKLVNEIVRGLLSPSTDLAS